MEEVEDLVSETGNQARYPLEREVDADPALGEVGDELVSLALTEVVERNRLVRNISLQVG